MPRDAWIGLGVAGFALFVLLVLVPLGVATPKNVRAIVLSPVFWPNIVSVLVLIGGFGLAAAAWWRRSDVDQSENEVPPGGGRRILAVAAIMIVVVPLLPWLGMVWGTMAAFAAFLIIVRTRYRVAGIVTALILPLALYAFFYHVAGVAIPQGRFVLLP